MKRLSMLAVVLFLALTTYAQSFEGTIKWSMELNITDSATKAKMDEARKQLDDPAMQAKMKELQARMNDPQFKAMIEGNPQMKAQMEMAMKLMESHDVSSMIPKGVTVKVKDNNMLANMDGGVMNKMEILYTKDKPGGIRIDRNNKTYSVLSPGNAETQKPDAKVTNTGLTMKILNHTCTKYIVEITSPDGKQLQQIFWTTREISLDMKTISQYKVGKSPLFYDQLEGVPLRIELTMPEGRVILEVTDLKKEFLTAAEFQIPADYKEVKGMGY
jgi:Domain of unknown function (DUF4412)